MSFHININYHYYNILTLLWYNPNTIYKGCNIEADRTVTKLKILTFIPIFIISVMLLMLMYRSINQLKVLEVLQHNTLKIKHISRLIIDLQQERGLSSGFLGSGGKKFIIELSQIRKEVDKDYTKLSNTTDLSHVRREIDTLTIPTIQAFTLYTNIIKEMQKYYFETAMHIDDAYLSKQIQVYLNLSFMQEALGRVRGSFNGIFTQKDQLDKQLLYNALHSKGMYDSSRERFNATSPQAYIEKIHTITMSPEYHYVDHIVNKYASLQFEKPTEDPQKWFATATKIIDNITKVEESLIENIDDYIIQKTNIAKLEIGWQALFLILILGFSSWFSYKLKNDILRFIVLLRQYKDAVDRSSIVSKTDKRGKITYANDKFCAISGYSREELVGKPHNIVRHKDMPKEAFREMWDTILAKKPWTGIVKNQKKDGDFYIVEATINPILDHTGKIEEFIAIRNDITEIVTLQEELEHTQEELIFKMGEITEARNEETAYHVKRVALYSELLGKLYGLDDIEVKYLTAASPMHDIGKVGIHDDILLKPGKLTEEEWAIMQTHTQIGYELFKESKRPLLQAAATIAHEHHEKYDGSGYPRGLKGEDIHIYGRITAVADVFDALGTERSYKRAWSDEKIFAYFKEQRGKHFDPQLVDLFFAHLDKFLEIRESFGEGKDYSKK